MQTTSTQKIWGYWKTTYINGGINHIHGVGDEYYKDYNCKFSLKLLYRFNVFPIKISAFFGEDW